MIIPWNTDAPVYHRPWGTIALIAANVAATVALSGDDQDAWVLVLGEGLHPVQWVTANFIHRGLGQLIGNMVFLWSFALVVEGKLGGFKFLAIYLGLGTFLCALAQVLTLGSAGGSACGAAAIICALMAMALVWAPENELSCIAFFRFSVHTFDVPILAFAVIYIALQVAVAAFFGLGLGFAVTTVLLEIAGAALGFALATVLLKAGWVDCEHWDLYAVVQGRRGLSKAQAERQRKKSVGSSAKAKGPGNKRRRPSLDEGGTLEDRATQAQRRLRHALDEGDVHEALAEYDTSVRSVANWEPFGPDWLDLIKMLVAEKLWRESVTVMEDYLRRSPDPSPRVRITLAQVLIRELQRPAHALRVLGAIPVGALSESLEVLRRQLTRQAQEMREEGILELEGDAW